MKKNLKFILCQIYDTIEFLLFLCVLSLFWVFVGLYDFVMKYKKLIINSLLAGVLIAIGGTALLITRTNTLGYLMSSVFFSIALLTICYFEYALFTGKVGELAEVKSVKDLGETTKRLAIILIFNFIGTFLVSLLTRLAYPDGHFIWHSVYTVVLTRNELTHLSIFILAFLCDILIHIAVHAYKKNKPGGVLLLILGVVVFIVSGFIHSIADSFYFFLNNDYTLFNIGWIASAVLGNSLGGIFIAYLDKERNK